MASGQPQSPKRTRPSARQAERDRASPVVSITKTTATAGVNIVTIGATSPIRPAKAAIRTASPIAIT